jgi:hypothetical protein
MLDRHVKALRPRPILPRLRPLAAALVALATIAVLSALLLVTRPPASVPSSSTVASAATGTATTAPGPSSASPLAFDCSLPSGPASPTPYPTAVPSLGKPVAAPGGWPVSLENMEAPGRLTEDGTSYFIEGGYLVAVDGSGRERPGWPQPLGLRTDLNTQLAFGSDGTVYVWDDSTVVAYRADGTRLDGWPYRTPAVEDVLPVPQGVYVESDESGSAACGDESHRMAFIGAAGTVQPSWRLQGEIAAVGPDGTLYTRQGDSILAYGSDGAVKPGWPATGWSNVSLDPSGRVYLSWWKFREISGISMEGPGEALETRIAAVDENGQPYAGWPVTIEGAASEPAFGPDGTVYVTREIYASGSATDSVLAFDASGRPKPGWPISVPVQDILLRSLPGVSAAAPDPPQVGTDGTVFFGAEEADPSSPGILEEVDPSGRPKPGFPASIDWGSSSNLFFGYGSGWFAVGRTGLVFTTTGYSVLAVGPDGKAASGWPVKAPEHTIVMAADPEPDGGLLVQALESSLVTVSPAAGQGSSQAMGDRLAALAPDFPGTLLVIRYLPDGTVAPGA